MTSAPCRYCGANYSTTHSHGCPNKPKPGVTVLHAQTFTPEELADFEQAIFACQNPNTLVAKLAKTSLAAIVAHHGKAKCDLMAAALNAKYTREPGNA
ncbi:hypothetical protein [Bradyrhizobium sp. 33ap4]|uniref:hypothetical protein n=1 Tax=Bradyrhizobium sp. 33ap4 TaxID=3061630 RepID=UPI00292EAB0A|nr:hypothetical protein [Bradyrhizobium sp. 33ap4]